MHSCRPTQRFDGQPAVAYLRRSTDRQEQSLPDQRAAIERFATERGLQIQRFYIDDAISGTSTTRRKAFLELIADAQSTTQTPFSYVIVYDVKRFGRSGNDEAGYYRHVLRMCGVEVFYVSENFSGDGTDDLLRPVKQWQAREESKDLSKVTIRGLLSKAPGGWWMGGAPPYGYDLCYTNDHGPRGDFLFTLRYQPDRTKLVLDIQGAVLRTLAAGESLNVSKRDHARLLPSCPERVRAVERIFRMSAEENKGFRSIAATLNQDRLPAPRGPSWSHIHQGAWTASTIRAILVNPLYVGDMIWNRRTDARFHRISGGRATERADAYGARLVPNPEADWIRVPDAHPPLVSRKLFELAQEARESRPTSQRQRGPRATGGWKGNRSRFLLSGIVQCARCGGRYEGCRRAKGRPKVDGSHVFTFYYGCGSYIRKSKSACSFGPIDQALFEHAVVEAVVAHYGVYTRDAAPEPLAKVVRECVGKDSEEVADARERVRAELAQLKLTISNLLDNITPTNRSFVDERLGVLAAEKADLERRLDELERVAVSRFEVGAVVSECREFIHKLPALLLHGSPDERLRALRRCVGSIVVDADARRARLTVHRLPVVELMGQSLEIEVLLPKPAGKSGSAPEPDPTSVELCATKPCP